MNRTAQKHLDAIRAGVVDRSNVIGLRKLINASERQAAGYSVSVTACTISGDDLLTIENALATCKPIVTGDLHETGLKLLRSPRYAKRLQWQQTHIARIHAFRLVRFDRIGARDLQSVPVYVVKMRPEIIFSRSAISLGNLAGMVRKFRGGNSDGPKNPEKAHH
ncbi:MAG: hypothetical protein HC788_04910 [Sphingopyxis sp.]|nr:hypothetical protein [Sphingopyxis sp.]